MDEADIDAHLFLDYPDPADVYEDALAELLGLVRAPWANYRTWRVRRREFIERRPEADDFADLAGRIADQRLSENASKI